MSISHQPDSETLPYPIIVHSQMRWDGIWGRAQQLLSRLSRRHPVLFVEPPLFEASLESRRATRVARGCHDVAILEMYLPVSRQFATMWLEAEQRRILLAALHFTFEGKFKNAIHWYDNPMVFNIFNLPGDRNVAVYDCIREPSQVRGASFQTARREGEMLDRADLVFTTSRALQSEKCRFTDNCHVLSSGVDARHFGAAREAQTLVPHDIAHLAGPILGYFGTIDERLDFPLLEKLADVNPHWNIVMIGPMERLEDDEVPQRDNIHWLGAREYSQLPAYAKAFDACLMPFVLNEATRGINPTKTLEYMATGKPVISTALPELLAPFAGALYMAHSHDDFLLQCRAAISHPDTAMLQSGLARASENSWDAVVMRLERHLDETVAQNRVRRSGAALPIRPMATQRKAFTL